MTDNFEVETTLAICSVSPEDIVDEITRLRSIGPYELSHKVDVQIHDHYVDLADHSLGSFGLGLRIRDVNGTKVLTLKGKRHNVPGGGIQREELELPWSAATLRTLTMRLEECGVNPPLGGAEVELRDPLSVLSDMGFRIDQHRSTKRRPRDVSEPGGHGALVAELVVDSVQYHFGIGDVRHHEVEIEQKGEGTVKDIQDVTQILLSRRPDSLREWHFGKRSTGRAAETLLAKLGPSMLVSASGNLLPEAYDLILAQLA